MNRSKLPFLGFISGGFLIIFVLVALGHIFYPFTYSTLAAETFTRNLKVGDTGYDVLLLQKLLNSATSTQITGTGSGSRGQETSYFGLLTKEAVIKFQNQYAEEILTPSGLTEGTGFVGSATRKKLNVLILGQTSSVLTPQATTTSSNSSVPPKSNGSVTAADFIPSVQISTGYSTLDPQSATPIIFETSLFQVMPGTTVVLKGAAFLSVGNEIHIGDKTVIKDVTSTSSGRIIEFKVPSAGLTNGVYEIWVVNSKGSSKDSIKQFIKIASTTLIKPTIINTFPVSTNLQGTVVVNGTGFTPTDNTIYSTFGILKKVPSLDGKTLTFKIADLSSIENVESVASPGQIMPVSFTVGNANGVTLQAGIFKLTF